MPAVIRETTARRLHDSRRAWADDRGLKCIIRCLQRAFQPADDKRPFEEFMMEQVALAEEIGGQLTFEELSRRLDEDEKKDTEGRLLSSGG